MLIREAILSDYSGIAKVHVDCWLNNYQRVLPIKLLEELSYREREDLWKKILLNDKVWVVENDHSEIVGFVHGGINRTSQYEDYQGEIYALHILKDYQNLGLGRMLIRTLLDDLKQHNITSLMISIFEDDSFCTFYENLGAQKIDCVQVDLEGQTVNEAIYGWDALPQI